jgi:hypothetical protein
MAEIDVTQDLGLITIQIEDLLKQLQELDGQRANLAQQIQNLNGVAMYLRGKESPEAVEVSEDTDKES